MLCLGGKKSLNSLSMVVVVSFNPASTSFLMLYCIRCISETAKQRSVGSLCNCCSSTSHHREWLTFEDGQSNISCDIFEKVYD